MKEINVLAEQQGARVEREETRQQWLEMSDALAQASKSIQRALETYEGLLTESVKGVEETINILKDYNSSLAKSFDPESEEETPVYINGIERI